eukprot:Hpha_TRINITY_DN9011_c0_g1::TRINITY_DN9011_c0_g1_i1::g.141759::m.141759
MMEWREELLGGAGVVSGLSWRYAFRDPTGTAADSCVGPRDASEFCSYGREFDCFVENESFLSPPLSTTSDTTPTVCQSSCALSPDCQWWSINTTHCLLFKERGERVSCEGCFYGPRVCP